MEIFFWNRNNYEIFRRRVLIHAVDTLWRWFDFFDVFSWTLIVNRCRHRSDLLPNWRCSSDWRWDPFLRLIDGLKKKNRRSSMKIFVFLVFDLHWWKLARFPMVWKFSSVLMPKIDSIEWTARKSSAPLLMVCNEFRWILFVSLFMLNKLRRFVEELDSLFF